MTNLRHDTLPTDSEEHKDFKAEDESGETEQKVNSPEQQAEQMKWRIQDAKEWAGKKLEKLSELMSGDIKLNEELMAKLSPQIEENRRKTIEELYRSTLALLKKTEDTEQYFDEKFDELERLSKLNAENYKGITPEKFFSLPKIEQRILASQGLVEQEIKNSEDPETLISWATTEKPVGIRDVVKMVEEKLVTFANKANGTKGDTKLWSLLYYKPLEKFLMKAGYGNEKDQVISRRESLEEMDEQTAAEFFEMQFVGKDKTKFNGTVSILGNYFRHVPVEKRNTELVKQAEAEIAERWSGSEEETKQTNMEGYQQVFAELENLDSPTSMVMQAVWKGDMDTNPLDSKKQYIYNIKESNLLNRLKEILQNPEQGQQYLDYFVKKCGIKNLDRFSPALLDKVYADREDKEKPYGLIVLATADYNGAFNKDEEMYDGFYKTLEQNGYKLLLSEADSDRAVLKNIQNAFSRKGSRKMSFLIVGGHGQPESIQFGNQENIHKRSRKNPATGEVSRNASIYEDEDSHIRMTVRASRKYIEPQAEVLTIACSSGMKDEKGTYPIAQAVANRTGLRTKGLSKPLGVSNLRSFIKTDGKIGLDIDVKEGMSLELKKYSKIPAKLETFYVENHNAASYDYLTRSSNTVPRKKGGESKKS